MPSRPGCREGERPAFSGLKSSPVLEPEADWVSFISGENRWFSGRSSCSKVPEPGRFYLLSSPSSLPSSSPSPSSSPLCYFSFYFVFLVARVTGHWGQGFLHFHFTSPHHLASTPSPQLIFTFLHLLASTPTPLLHAFFSFMSLHLRFMSLHLLFMFSLALARVTGHWGHNLPHLHFSSSS